MRLSGVRRANRRRLVCRERGCHKLATARCYCYDALCARHYREHMDELQEFADEMRAEGYSGVLPIVGRTL